MPEDRLAGEFLGFQAEGTRTTHLSQYLKLIYGERDIRSDRVRAIEGGVRGDEDAVGAGNGDGGWDAEGQLGR
jgi:hypothetical protein